MNFQYPNITEGTPAEQIAQMKRYLFSLVEKLNLGEVRTTIVQTGNAVSGASGSSNSGVAQPTPVGSFNQIKSLIIKSADIVEAFEDVMVKNFNGRYFADSDFGTYLRETSTQISANSERVEETYTMVEGVKNEVQTTNGYIRRGLLSNGEIGLEIGETSEDGAFRQYARFTAEKLSFYDKIGNEVAHIGSGTADEEDTNCLYITGKAVFKNDVKIGGYMIDRTDGLAFVWVG